MKNLDYCHENLIEGIKYRMDIRFWGFAKHVLYLLSIDAQDAIEKKTGSRPDICLLTNCEVVRRQQTVYPTEDTTCKLLGLDLDKGLIIELFGTERREIKFSQYLTTSGQMSNGLYCGLLIAEEDIQKILS